MKQRKTNAARQLDNAGIPYRTASYPVDESDLSAAHLARGLGIDPAVIFKTLVLRGDKSGVFVCLVPGDGELDLKKAARASGNKSCSLLPVKELQAVTGYVRGGCSPLGMKKRFPTYADASIAALDEIYVSAGRRGLQLVLSPKDLLAVAGAETADLLAE